MMNGVRHTVRAVFRKKIPVTNGCGFDLISAADINTPDIVFYVQVILIMESLPDSVKEGYPWERKRLHRHCG